jgi:TrpR family trp operon transcriptional repressor
LVKEIDKGSTQREIAKKFRMSLCKITRGSKELSKSDSAFRKMLELLKDNSN